MEADRRLNYPSFYYLWVCKKRILTSIEIDNAIRINSNKKIHNERT